MKQKELDKILADHKEWLNNSETGNRANLQHADLQDANLRHADLQRANLQDTNLQDSNLQGANLHGADLQDADLQGANLQGANLQGANLQGANLDYSCLPLWCGGTLFKADDKLIMQVLAHLCSLEVSDTAKAELDKIRDFAKKSHRAEECGLL